MKICFNPLRDQIKRVHDIQPIYAKKGFTLYELMISVTIIGLLTAIMTPVWLHLVDSNRIGIAQNTIFQGIRTAQHKAKTSRVAWKFSIRETNSIVQWAIYPGETLPPDSLWSSLDTKVKLDNETTLRKIGDTHQVQFNHRGNVNGQLGRVTLSLKGVERMKRCVIISTLLGAVRQSSNQPRLSDGKSCY